MERCDYSDLLIDQCGCKDHLNHEAWWESEPDRDYSAAF